MNEVNVAEVDVKVEEVKKVDKEAVPEEQPYKNIPQFIDREKSWLEFNKRVLEQALRPDMTYNKKLEFIGIASNNLDEFISVRFSGIYHQHKNQESHRNRELYKQLIRDIKEQKNRINDVASQLLSIGVVEKQIHKREEVISNEVIRYFEKEI